jgi:hypothetical protein
MTHPLKQAVEHAVAAYARMAVSIRDSLGRGRFVQDLGQASTGRPEGAPPLPVHIRLGVGEHPLRPVTTAYVAGPDGALATVADALHALADEIHPPATGESVADLIRRKTRAEAPDPDDDEGPVRYRDAEGDLWETVPGTDGDVLLDVAAGTTSNYDRVLSLYGPLTLADHDEDQEGDQ